MGGPGLPDTDSEDEEEEVSIPSDEAVNERPLVHNLALEVDDIPLSPVDIYKPVNTVPLRNLTHNDATTSMSCFLKHYSSRS